MKEYDFIVIGTGAANIVTDAAIDAGKTVAIIEQDKFGGTCLNRGCVPSKILITPVDYKKDFERLKKEGLVKGSFEIDWDVLTKRMELYTRTSNNGLFRNYNNTENVDIYQGKAYFVGKKILEVKLNDGTISDKLTAEHILLANGATSRIPNNIKGMDKVDYITSENFFGEKYPEKPYKSLAILGGGVIAAEFSHLFSNLGTKVSIIQHGPRLLQTFDEDIVEVVADEYKEAGIDVYLQSEMVEIEEKDGMLYMLLENLETGEKQTVTAENLMLAIGLVPNNDLLQVDKTGIKTDERGWIRSNEFLETSVDGIYSIGDANGKFQLRHVANYEAQVLAYNLFERARDNSGKALTPRRRIRYDVVPASVFTQPQMASVGLNSEMAKAAGYEIVTTNNYYAFLSKPYAMGFKFGKIKEFVKVIADKTTRKILGVQIVGPEAAIIIQPYVNLMNSGSFKYEIIEPDIASEETILERKNIKERFLDPRTADALNYTMTIHPALTEVATWAADNLEFDDDNLNAEHRDI